MNKPASVAILEFKNTFDKLLRECGLPPVVLEPIVTAYANALGRMAAEQTNAELKEWLDSQKETKEE